MVSSKTEELNKDESNLSVGEKSFSYDEKLYSVSTIAKPMASRKLTRKLHKLIKKAAKQKTFLRHGLKDVQTQIRKGEKGVVVFAGDVTPIEVMCHMPAVCEEKNIPYVFTPSREDIGSAMGVKRSCLMVLIKEHDEYKDLYTECYNALDSIPVPT